MSRLTSRFVVFAKLAESNRSCQRNDTGAVFCLLRMENEREQHGQPKGGEAATKEKI